MSSDVLDLFVTIDVCALYTNIPHSEKNIKQSQSLKLFDLQLFHL